MVNVDGSLAVLEWFGHYARKGRIGMVWWWELIAGILVASIVCGTQLPCALGCRDWEHSPIKLIWCPICQNWPKIGNFQAISRVPEKFWKFPRMMKFWNSMLKIKFLDIYCVGLIPYMLKLVKTSQFQGTFGILESWIPGSRNHNISQNVRKINTNMLRRLVF